MSTTTYEANYTVIGMTCDHCVSAVAEEIGRIPGVAKVTVDLVAGGVSAVHLSSERPIHEATVRDAVDEAGYEFAGPAS